MPEIRIKPYPREGTPHHLYADSPDGAQLGVMNLRTSEIVIDDRGRANEVATALAQWCQRNHHVVVAARATSGKARPPRPRGEEDYALNRPGQLARASAQQARNRIRKRSRFWSGMAELLRIDDGQPFIKGAKGEERMARVLKRMERKGTWRVLHSIPLPKGGDIDHLLVGRDGVIVINTKHHWHKKITVGSDDIYVGRARTDHVRQVRHQAATASTLLTKACVFEVKVTPCVAIYNGGQFAPEIKRSGTPKGVIVATNWNLPRALWDADDGLIDEIVEAIYEAARRPATWKG